MCPTPRLPYRRRPTCCKTQSPFSSRYALPIATLLLSLGIYAGAGLSGVVWPLASLLLAALAAMFCKAAFRRAAMLVAFLCLGLTLGYVAEHPSLPPEETYQLQGVVCEEITQSTSGQWRTILRDVQLNGKPYRKGVYWMFRAEAVPEGLRPGCRVTMTAQLRHPQGQRNPGCFDFRHYLLAKDITLCAYDGLDDLTCTQGALHLGGLCAAARHALSQRLQAVMGDESGAYAAAMLLGLRSLAPSEELEAFTRLGIGHLLSVSGYHAGVLYALLQLLLRRLHIPVKKRLAPVAFVMAGFSLLTGMNPPVVRASLLVVLRQIGRHMGRDRLNFHLLCAAAMAQLLVAPALLYSSSFQLSYAAMLGITLLTDTLNRALKPVLPWRKLRSSVSVAISAQLGVLLPELYWYHNLPVLGLLGNVALLGIASVMLACDWLCLFTMAVPVLGIVTGTIADAATRGFLWCVHALDRLPGGMIWTRQANWLTAIGWLLLLFALCCYQRKIGWRQCCAALLGILLLTTSVYPWPTHGTTYTQLSVGEADAAVVRDEDFVMVIDTGESGELADYLHAQRLSVDTLVLTHLHADHAGGVAALLDNNIPIRRCYLPVDAETLDLDESMRAIPDMLRATGTEVCYVSRGDRLTLPSGEATVLWPESGGVRAGQEANHYSLTLRIQLHATTLLSTGDLTSTYEHYAAIPADVLKAAHHGSTSSTSADFLRTVSPRLVLLSCGRQSRIDGFLPRTDDIPCLDTLHHGAITLRFDEEGFTTIPYLAPP